MRKTKEPKKIRCIVYLSSVGDIYSTDVREDNQFRYISDYAKAHKLLLVKKVRRNNESQRGANLHWNKMVEMIKKDVADAILLVNMASVSIDVPDSFKKVGQVYEAGGVVITVDEGTLTMPVKVLVKGRMVLANEKH